MSQMNLSTSMRDFFIKDPVSFWTGKNPDEVEALDAVPLYAAAAFPLALMFVGSSGCDATTKKGEEIETAGTTETNGSECTGNEANSSYSGSPETRLIGICKDKIDTCVNGYWKVTQEEVLPQEEVKENGLDDDCDGALDECSEGETRQSYSGALGSEGEGICTGLAEICAGGAWQTTQAEVLPQDESAQNGVDDDCDGMTDECGDGETRQTYSGPAETRNVNVCRDFVEICNDGLWGAFQTEVLPQNEVQGNGFDDDCDGMTDECADNETRMIYSGDPATIDRGRCKEGTETCGNGLWQTTVQEVVPQTENKTNGFDDDCDGMTDECADNETRQSFSGPAANKNVGICKEKIETCGSGLWQTTRAEVLPQIENKTNGLDDDCDHMVDECIDGETQQAYTAAVETKNVGPCREQVTTCSNGSWPVTQTMIVPRTEIYTNGIDDDCDGSVDEIDLDARREYINSCTMNPEFISLKNGASVVFNCNSVELTTDVIEIGETSSIEVLAQGCGQGNGASGTGPYDGGGGGGGAHIGSGGAGVRGSWTGGAGSGGVSYGSAEDFVAEPGSCGGTGGGPYGGAGGRGGGAIKIVSNTANIYGAIYAYGKNGYSASYDDGGGGGGSGGSIVIDADILGISLASTLLSVNGGIGGYGGFSYGGGGAGGGGGGGSVELRFNTANIPNVGTYSSGNISRFTELMAEFGNYNISGGISLGNGAAGQEGALNVAVKE